MEKWEKIFMVSFLDDNREEVGVGVLYIGGSPECPRYKYCVSCSSCGFKQEWDRGKDGERFKYLDLDKALKKHLKEKHGTKAGPQSTISL